MAPARMALSARDELRRKDERFRCGSIVPRLMTPWSPAPFRDPALASPELTLKIKQGAEAPCRSYECALRTWSTCAG